VEYKHRLYVCWRMIPDFRYYGYYVMYMKVVEDYDTDGDGYMDTADVFPDDPADLAGFRQDGAGDNTDPAPYDPDIWLEIPGAAGAGARKPGGGAGPASPPGRFGRLFPPAIEER